MKIIQAIVISLVMFLTGFYTSNAQTIEVSVVNATSNEGKVSFALFTKDNFMKIPLQQAKAIVKEGKSTVIFKNVPSGEYAITCYHDKNDNGKMDFQPNGMPIEDYGASNNVMNFGPPQYNDAKFEVTNKDVSLEIRF
ncbi:DUF2141 domain-containing protein [Tenacibaculum sp. IB213877]|uniref:DUF2141 domain-containing protein n=1 Tax=Tenacibaculum sp. IB213877 TaxID=3097351 RepID=UPI002A5AB8FA|nr:DUF2141 domain-containing protein [Tenacibaculum sp. IB213877]MDY0779227.1 DUF2141 domain-containing protein [Tenacibaculum sp. IB213877]